MVKLDLILNKVDLILLKIECHEQKILSLQNINKSKENKSVTTNEIVELDSIKNFGLPLTNKTQLDLLENKLDSMDFKTPLVSKTMIKQKKLTI